jgi:hypothetical protein
MRRPGPGVAARGQYPEPIGHRRALGRTTGVSAPQDRSWPAERWRPAETRWNSREVSLLVGCSQIRRMSVSSVHLVALSGCVPPRWALQAIWDRTADGLDGLVHRSDARLRKICRFATAHGWSTPASTRRSAVSATPTTTAWPRRSSGCTRRGGPPPWAVAQGRRRRVATLKWVHRFNTIRLFGPLGYVPPAEHEANYYSALGQQVLPGLN